MRSKWVVRQPPDSPANRLEVDFKACRAGSRVNTGNRKKRKRVQTHEIRKRFLDHFVKAGHTEVPSASVILDDPNLLFVNAGMVQFVPFFLGAAHAAVCHGHQHPKVHPHSRYRRGGHHHPAQHLLPDGRQLLVRRLLQARGHRSWPGTLLTNSVSEGGYGLNPEKLWATVYLDDDEACAAVAGDRRPAGRADPAPRHGRQLLVDGHPRAVRAVVGDLLRPRAGVRRRGRPRSPTRTATSRSGTSCSCRTSAARAPARKTSRSSGRCRARTSTPAWVSSGSRSSCRACTTSTKPTCCGRSSTWSPRAHPRGYDTGNHDDDVRYRIIADHSRTAAILIGDGVSPGNDGRGYVLRRLLRRVIRSAKLLGIDTPDRRRPDGHRARRDGPVVPGTGHRLRPDPPHRGRRGDRVQPHAGVGFEAVRRGGRRHQGGWAPSGLRLGRLHPARHLRLPDRAHAGDGLRGRPARSTRPASAN